MTRSLDALLEPASVAVVGASDDRERIGGRVLGYLLDAPFDGTVHAVNPRRERVQGLTAHDSLRDIDEAVDVVVLAVPASGVVEQITLAGECGARAAIVFSAGFAETGAAGADAQAVLAGAAARAGVRLLGPNCLGAWNASRGFLATFSTSFHAGLPAPGRIALASQSGAFGAHMALLARRRGLDVGHFVTTGNESDVEVAECIAWYAGRDDVDMVLVYLEGVRDGRALVDAFALARANRKPVLCLKVGRTPAGATAAESHTAALAGADTVFDAICEQYGVYRAPDMEALLDVAYALTPGRLPRGPRTGLVTMSGGVGIQMTDEASRLGLALPAMPEDCQARLMRVLPYAAVRNPVDFTAQFINQPELLPTFIDAVMDEGGYDAVVAFFTYTAAVRQVADHLLETLRAAIARHPHKLVMVCITGDAALTARYEACGCLVFEDPCRALRALAVLCALERQLGRTMSAPVAHGLQATLPPQPLNEYAAKRWLASAGLPVIAERHVADSPGAEAAAVALGFPLVAKLSGAELLHKTELGGVIVGITDAAALQDALDTLSKRAVGQLTDGFLICEQAAPGVEMILGAHNDPAFGMTVMVGFGGTLAEVLDDVALRLAPVSADEARAMLDSLRGRALLDGVRGAPAADMEALVAAIVALSRLVAHRRDIASIDLNPVRVLPIGHGAVVLDAVVSPSA